MVIPAFYEAKYKGNAKVFERFTEQYTKEMLRCLSISQNQITKEMTVDHK